MKIIYVLRKTVEGNFSIENIFTRIASNLPPDVYGVVRYLKYSSEGFFKRLYSCFEVLFFQSDVYHITGDIHFVAFFLPKRKTVLTVHDVGFMANRNTLARLLLLLFWIRLPVRGSAAITTVSMATKLDLLNYVKVHPSRIRVIYNPISSVFKPTLKQFNKRVPTILQIGTKPNKNIPRIAKALKGIPCRLNIIGRVDKETELLLKFCQIDYVEFSGLSEEQVFEQYVACDIVAFVSNFEGFGLPIVEANAVGRVVLAGNVSSMPEVAGDSAHLVDPLDIYSIRMGILKIIQEDDYRALLILNGFKNVKRFDLACIEEQYTDLYKAMKS